MLLAAMAGTVAVTPVAGDAGTHAPLSPDEPAAVTALAGDLLRLADGRVVRLAGIRVPANDLDTQAARYAEQARLELGVLVEGHALRLVPAAVARDRYGRLVAQVERSDGLWLQGALLEQGLAQVQTRPGEAIRAGAMLARERAARTARRGLWAEPAFQPRSAGTVDATSTGRFRIVRGRVLRVASTDRYVYLNFGADWRVDFTVRVRRADLRDVLAGLELDGLAGRMIEVRGVVLEAGGPLIELSHLEQMQVLP